MITRRPLSILALTLALTGSLLGSLTPASSQNLEQFERARVLRVLSLLQPH